MTGSILSFSNLWNGEPTSIPPYIISLNISTKTGDVLIHVDAPFMDDVPPEAAPGRLENLYEYEVVELFVSGTHSDSNSPYLEIQVGPHGHYMLIFFMKEADWANQDPTLDLDQPPKIVIDHAAKRWSAEVIVPSYLLPEPECGADLSVSWNVNAFAAFDSGEKRQLLACYPVPGDVPNFHQLKYMKPIKLHETDEVRGLVDRGRISIVNDKMHRLTLADDQPEAWRKSDKEDLSDAEDAKGAEEVLVGTVEVAAALRDKIAQMASSPALLVLEEKFFRHVQTEHGEFAILHSKVWKRKGISFKRRTLILTSKPRLFYLDGDGRYKGNIPWTMMQRIHARRVSIPALGYQYSLQCLCW
jgi:hypothetical protein